MATSRNIKTKNMNDKIKSKCGVTVYAECVNYEKTLPEFSSLVEEGCVNISETTNDIYTILGEIKEEINLEELENTCITFIEPKTPKSVIEQMYNKLCELEGIITEQTSQITDLTERITLLEANPCT